MTPGPEERAVTAEHSAGTVGTGGKKQTVETGDHR